MFNAASVFKLSSRPVVEVIGSENVRVTIPSGLTPETYGVTVFCSSTFKGSVVMIGDVKALSIIDYVT